MGKNKGKKNNKKKNKGNGGNKLYSQLSKAEKRAAVASMTKGMADMKFGPVSTINTAPIAIGNSIRGSASKIKQIPNGVRVIGRDFMFSAISTGDVNTWTVCGGTPLTPAAFSDSVLANYMRMYSRFRWKTLVAHYITSSSTTTTGDIVFYLNKDRSSVFLNQTSSQFLPFVISDPNTVLGPQWVNHSARFTLTSDWKLCDYGMHDGVEEYATGDLFLLSKTASTASPGYVIFDYELEFAELQIQPRLLTFPIPRIQWQQVCIGRINTTTDADAPVVGARALRVQGNGISGSGSTNPFRDGDIVKIIIDLTNSNTATQTWSVGLNAGNIFKTSNATAHVALTIKDGTTIYGVYDASNVGFALYENATQAYDAGSDAAIHFGVTVNDADYYLQTWMSYVGTTTGDTLNPNF